MSNARPAHPRVPGRALLAVAVGCIAAGVVLGLVALRPSSEADRVVLDVTSATAAQPPSTISLLPEPTPTAASAKPATTVVTATTEPGVDHSPLAALLGGTGSAIPPAVETRIRPRSLTIDDVFVSGPVRAVGLEDDGRLEVPDETEIGWYRYGSSPGRAGATVLAAHVTWNQTLGPFFNLGELAPGARVDVELDDGSIRTYQVIERTMYDKDDLPRDRIWRTTGPETLVLITCGGSFNPDINRYRQNIVVYAVPVDTSADRSRS